MFDLVFLGTAAAVPSADRSSPALLVIGGPERFLIDCGEGTQRQLMRARVGFRGLGHVLLTHLHLDHVAGLAGLLATRPLYQLDDPINIIGTTQTIGFVARYLSATIGSEQQAPYRLCVVAPGPVLCRPGWRLTAFAVGHRGTESLGYIFEAAARRPGRECVFERLAFIDEALVGEQFRARDRVRSGKGGGHTHRYRRFKSG